MKTKSVLTVCVVLISFSQASAWNIGTHVYMADNIGSSDIELNANEMYGSVLPDFANFMSDTLFRQYLYAQTHNEFERLWRQSWDRNSQQCDQALAYGFVSHNDQWGADYTAHHNALTTTGEGGNAEGYVITKAMQLHDLLAIYNVWVYLDIAGEEYADLRLEICHVVIEYAVDIHLRENDADLGTKIVLAVQNACDESNSMLIKAYAGNLVAFANKSGVRMNRPEAVELLQETEAGFANLTMLYGSLLMPENIGEVKTGVSEYLALLASLVYGLDVDPLLAGLVLEAAYSMTGDCGNEVEATIEYLSDALPEHGIDY